MSESAYNKDRRDAGPTELAAFQAALARLSPAPDGINIARLLFRAGQLSAPRRSLAWPCATAASMLAAGVLASMLVFRPAPQPAERIVTIYVQPAPLPTPQAEQSAPASEQTPVLPISSAPGGGDGDYLRLRRDVLFHGLDALPPPPMWSTTLPAVEADTLRDTPRGSGEPWLLRLKHSLQSGGPS